MAETEKITINMNVVDLGKVDLLADQGFYSNRTDFIRTAIRNQLAAHSTELEEIVIRKSFVIGALHYSKKELVKLRAANTKINVKVVGLLAFDDDIDGELIKETVESVFVKGILKANSDVKAAIESLQ